MSDKNIFSLTPGFSRVRNVVGQPSRFNGFSFSSQRHRAEAWCL
jgi:hypothetical protein